MAKICIMPGRFGQAVALNWAEGIAFHHKPLLLKKKTLLEKRMECKVCWASVMIANMPEYRSSLKFGDRDISALKTPNPLLK